MKRVYQISIPFVVFFVFHFAMYAARVDSTSALQVASNFYIQNDFVATTNGVTLHIKKTPKTFINVTSATAYNNLYIFNATDGNGFVIMAADDRSCPILGYSDKGIFRTDSIAPQVADWLLAYDREIDYLITNNIPATEDIANEWQCLRNGTSLPIRNTRSVSPLLQTTWNQTPYYNLFCPFDEDEEEYTVTGCVATAMAQVLKYWEYPNVGIGSHSYYDLNYGWQSADFETIIYWNEMPAALSASSTIMQKLSVASLMRLCGVSVNMQYGLESSGISNMESVVSAMINHFNYVPNLTLVTKNNYSSDTQWMNLLKNELDNARPVLYKGTNADETAGHAFVCDGYNNNNYFHFNWGWNGTYDGYFQVSSLNPGSGQVGGGTGDYSYNQQCIIGCEPAGTVQHPNYDLVMNSNVTTNASTYSFGDNITVSRSIRNSGTANFSGYIIVMITDDYGNQVARTCNYATISPNNTNTSSVYFSGSEPLVPGEYIVNVLSATDTNDLNTYRFVRDNTSYQNLAQFSITYSSNMETYSDFTFSTGNVLYANRSATINVDVLNAGSSTFTGDLAVVIEDLNGNIVQLVEQTSISNGLQPNYHYTNGLDFTGTISVPAGEYFVTLLYKNPTATTWYYAGSTEYGNPVRISVLNSPTPDIYEQNNTVATAYSLTPNFDDDTCWIYTTGSNIHVSNDVDYYKVVLPMGFSYEIVSVLCDHDGNLFSAELMQGENYYYSADCVYSVAVNSTSNWSAVCDNGQGPTSTLQNGGTIYFKVNSYPDEELLGDYLLVILITRQISPDQYEPNNTANAAYNLGSVSTNSRTIDIDANFHVTTDNDFYKVFLPANYNYTVNATIYTSYNTSNYTADAKFATSTNGSTWSNNYGTSMPQLAVNNGGTLYFRVLPYTSDEIGTYQLHITIQRTPIVGIEEIELPDLAIFPNPASDYLHIASSQNEMIKRIEILTIDGKVIENQEDYCEEINVSSLAAGTYLIRLYTQKGVVTKKWCETN